MKDLQSALEQFRATNPVHRLMVDGVEWTYGRPPGAPRINGWREGDNGHHRGLDQSQPGRPRTRM
jgi:hypothetical protein